MKKLLAISLAFVFALSLTACGGIDSDLGSEPTTGESTTNEDTTSTTTSTTTIETTTTTQREITTTRPSSTSKSDSYKETTTAVRKTTGYKTTVKTTAKTTVKTMVTKTTAKTTRKTDSANHVKTYGLGEKWVVSGNFEFKINSVIKHNLCDDNYDNDIDATTSVIINYTYKNLGSDKLKVDKWAFEVYDEQGTEGDALSWPIYCDHGTEATNCLTNGSCTVKLPVAIVHQSNSITTYVKIGEQTAIFKVAVTEPSAEDKAEMIEYSRVSGEFTYKYNDFVGTRGDGGAKVLFIPKNTELKSKDNKTAMMLGSSSKKYDSGIILEVCDGYGKFDTGVEYIPAGDYVVVVVSKNTKNSAQMTKESLSTYLGKYISDADLETLALFIGFSKCAIDDMTLKAGYSHTISNDFGVTYF